MKECEAQVERFNTKKRIERNREETQEKWAKECWE